MATLTGTSVTHQPLSDPPTRLPMFEDERDPKSFRTLKWLKVLAVKWQQWFSDVVRATTVQHVEITLNFPSTAAGSHSDLDIEFPGTELNHPVQLGWDKNKMLDGINYIGFIATAGIVTVRLMNYSTTAKAPAATNFIITVTL